MSRNLVRHRLSPDGLPDMAEELLGKRFPSGLVAAHDDGDPSASFTCSSPVGLIAVSSSNALFPQMIRRFLRWHICRFRPADSSAKWQTCTGSARSAIPKPRRLVRHAHWPEDWHPMRGRRRARTRIRTTSGHFPFVTVEGPGVYEIPVGPVHAGLIEPGHFRFSVVGETVLRLKARLWFVHRGLEKLFQGRSPAAQSNSPNASAATPPPHTRSPTASPSKTPWGSIFPTRCIGCGRCWSSSNGSTTTPPISARWPTTSDSPWPTRTPSASENNCCGSTPPSPGTGCYAAPSARAQSRCRRCPTPLQLRSIAADVAEVAELTLRNTVIYDRFAGTAVLHRRRRPRPGLPGICRARQRHAHRRPTRTPHHRAARH